MFPEGKQKAPKDLQVCSTNLSSNDHPNFIQTHSDNRKKRRYSPTYSMRPA